LEWLRDMKTVDDIHREGTVEADDLLLLSRLTSQRDKQQNGSTPLHLAASLEGWEDAGGLLDAGRKTLVVYLIRQVWQALAPQIRQVWAAPEVDAATLLLDVNLSTAYQADDEGSYPIHMAAHAGSLRVVRTLLERCPDCATMRDGKGRTFLHVAVEKEHLFVVRHVVDVVCSSMSRRMRIRILNVQDNNGDTALHGAVRAGNLEVFNYLLRDRHVRLDVTNKDGMTPLDLARSKIPPGFNFKLVSTSLQI
jgi:ankyrin repeat protein